MEDKIKISIEDFNKEFQSLKDLTEAIELRTQFSIVIKQMEKQFRIKNNISDCKSIFFTKENAIKYNLKYYSSLDYFMNLLISLQ
jgi:hypothetical protein